MKNFKAFFANLKHSNALNKFISGIKNISGKLVKHLDTIFFMLFFIIKFVLPKIVLPKFLCLPTIPTFQMPTFNNALFEEMFSPTAFQQETLIYLMLSKFVVRFTVKISAMFLSTKLLLCLAVFIVYLFLGKGVATKKVFTTTKPANLSASFYTHKIQFLN